MLLGISVGPMFRLLGGDMAITASLKERWPILAREPTALAWLGIRSDLGLAPRTLDAYSRGLSESIRSLPDVVTSLGMSGS